jgi:hypothetical protein
MRISMVSIPCKFESGSGQPKCRMNGIEAISDTSAMEVAIQQVRCNRQTMSTVCGRDPESALAAGPNAMPLHQPCRELQRFHRAPRSMQSFEAATKLGEILGVIHALTHMFVRPKNERYHPGRSTRNRSPLVRSSWVQKAHSSPEATSSWMVV